MEILPVWPPKPVKAITVTGCAGLEVLPYVRHRLVFAELAAQAILSGRYDQVLVDMPAFLDTSGWLSRALKCLPQVSLIAVSTQRRRPRVLVLSPSDAGTMAIWLSRKISLSVHCVDDPALVHYPDGALLAPDVVLPDDYRIHVQGLEAYFAHSATSLDAVWTQATRQQHLHAEHRATAVVRQINARAVSGRTLLLCEYQLWWWLAPRLNSPSSPEVALALPKTQPRRHRLIRLDPHGAWLAGLLDDYPAACADFWRGLRRLTGEARRPGVDINVVHFDTHKPMSKARRLPPGWRDGAFDKLSSVNDRIARALRGEFPPGHSADALPPRLGVVFVRYLRALTATAGRFVPTADEQLFHAARACGGNKLAEALATLLMRYTRPPAKWSTPDASREIKSGGAMPIQAGRLIEMHTGQSLSPWLASEALGEASRQRAPLLEAYFRNVPTDSVPKVFLLPRSSGKNFVILADYRLHQRAAQIAAVAVQGKQGARAYPTWGSLEGGIDWNATLSSFARNEQRIYIRQVPARRQIRRPEHKCFTPYVFLFADEQVINQSEMSTVFDANLSYKRHILGYETAPSGVKSDAHDHVYSVAYTMESSYSIAGGHIRVERLSSLATLYPRDLMGVARYTNMTRRAARFQCRTPIDEDEELAHLSSAEKMVAWAVKYALDSVVVVADKNWRPSSAVMGFIGRRGIKISRVPLTVYRPEWLNRLRRCHLISRELKRHPRREEILGQWVK